MVFRPAAGLSRRSGRGPLGSRWSGWSAAPGMGFASHDDDADWGKDKRRRRMGGLQPERCALVIQDGADRRGD